MNQFQGRGRAGLSAQEFGKPAVWVDEGEEEGEEEWLERSAWEGGVRIWYGQRDKPGCGGVSGWIGGGGRSVSQGVGRQRQGGWVAESGKMGWPG